jgi:hypothetical protein
MIKLFRPVERGSDANIVTAHRERYYSTLFVVN